MRWPTRWVTSSRTPRRTSPDKCSPSTAGWQCRSATDMDSTLKEAARRIAIVFPPQGTQFVGMGKDVYEASAAARRVFHQAEEALGIDLRKLCFEGPEELLRETINSQPAILTVSIACWEALKEKWAALGEAIQPRFFAGHSLGEDTALVQAGRVAATVPSAANVAGRATSWAEDTRRELVEQITSRVRWSQSILAMVEGGVQTIVEIGPGETLSGISRRVSRDLQSFSVNSFE